MLCCNSGFLVLSLELPVREYAAMPQEQVVEKVVEVPQVQPYETVVPVPQVVNAPVPQVQVVE